MSAEHTTLGQRVQAQFAARHADFDRASRWVTDEGLLAALVTALDGRHHQVLEVCAGTAQVGGALARAGSHVVAVDLSPDMLALARDRVAEVYVADAHALPFPDGSFERLLLRQAWHFLDPRTVPAELYRVACPGARLVTAQIVPFGDEDAAWVERIHRAKQRDLAWFPTEATLRRDLAAAGWQLCAAAELLLEEEQTAWLRWAPETPQAEEVLRLVREAPEPYRRLHRVREEAGALYDTFRWLILTCDKAGAELPAVPEDLRGLLRCPRCAGQELREQRRVLRCAACGASYPIDAGVPRLLID